MFASARQKITRADHHLSELEVLVGAAVSTEAIEVIEDRDGTNLVYRVKVKRLPPDNLALALGDCMHNLRSALDHVVYECVARPGNRRCQMPALSSRPSTSGWHKKLTEAAPGLQARPLRDWLVGRSPWPGGDDEDLWILSELDNLDKHRLMLTVVGAVKMVSTVTQADLLSPAEANLAAQIDASEGLLFEVSTDKPHPLLGYTVPQLKDARVEVSWLPPDPYPLADGQELWRLTRHERRRTSLEKCDFAVVFGYARSETQVGDVTNHVAGRGVLDVAMQLRDAVLEFVAAAPGPA